LFWWLAAACASSWASIKSTKAFSSGETDIFKQCMQVERSALALSLFSSRSYRLATGFTAG
jgi:hypothetical protein